MKYISIANRFCIEISGEDDSSAIAFILKELNHHVLSQSNGLPVIGQISFDDSLELPPRALELRKGILYEGINSLYISNDSTIICMTANPSSFQLTFGLRADNNIAFFTVEMLIRYYAPLYDIVFLHTGSFIWRDKVCTVSAFGGVGKTEVMLKAIELGAQFISDDFAIFNRDGQVFPYTKSIYLCDYPYDDYMLKATGKSKLLWKLKQFSDRNRNFLTRRISQRLETGYFGIKIDYSLLAKETPLRFYDVDSFYWVYRSSETREKEINGEEFVNCMKLCLDIESRRYFDYDGYLRLKFPFLEDNKQRQSEIITGIPERLKVNGLTIRNQDFNDLARLIFKLNTI